MNNRVVLDIEEVKEKFGLSESEILYKAITGELRACFFSPFLWMSYRVAQAVIIMGDEKLRVWGAEYSDIFYGYAILPADELREILARDGYTPKKFLYGKNLHSMNYDYHDIDYRTGEYDIDGLPFSLYPVAGSRIEFHIGSEFKLDDQIKIRKLIYKHHRDRIGDINEIFDSHGLVLSQRLFDFSRYIFVSKEMNLDASVIEEVKSYYEENAPERIYGGRVFFESLFKDLPWELLRRLLVLCVQLSNRLFEINRGESLGSITRVHWDGRPENLALFVEQYAIDHEQSILDHEEDYAEFFMSEFDVDLQKDEACYDYDERILDRIKEYRPPKLKKEDILIYHPDEKPFAFSEERGDSNHVIGEESEAKVSIVSHIDRFVQNLLAGRPSERFSVKSVASTVREKFRISESEMGQTKLENIVGAAIPESRKRGAKRSDS